MSTLVTDAGRPAAMTAASADAGLLTDEEVLDALRAALGDAVSGAQFAAAVASLRAAEMAKWEQLPPEINPDMGFNYRFLACTETCWLGRQILIEGATFRIFRQREQPA